MMCVYVCLCVSGVHLPLDQNLCRPVWLPSTLRLMQNGQIKNFVLACEQKKECDFVTSTAMTVKGDAINK